MAMTIKTEGLTEVSQILTALGDRAEDVATGALFDGAAVVADAFKRGTASIRTAPFKGKRTKRLPSPEEKGALIGRTGIAPFRKNGSEVETLIGVAGNAGYVLLGKKPKAVRLIARSINSGTSFMDKQPVFRKAKSSSQGAAKDAIVAKAEKMFLEIISKG